MRWVVALLAFAVLVWGSESMRSAQEPLPPPIVSAASLPPASPGPGVAGVIVRD